MFEFQATACLFLHAHSEYPYANLHLVFIELHSCSWYKVTDMTLLSLDFYERKEILHLCDGCHVCLVFESAVCKGEWCDNCLQSVVTMLMWHAHQIS